MSRISFYKYLIVFFLFCSLLSGCQPSAAVTPTSTSRVINVPGPIIESTNPIAATVTGTAVPTVTPEMATPSPDSSLIRFAVIGDYGTGDLNEEFVSDLVHTWSPDFIVTVGDNNYPAGSKDTIDDRIGRSYHDFIFPYSGNFGAGAEKNRFFPTIGNHDLVADGIQPYLDYFSLPGNERYYDFIWGPVHFFALDSEPTEPDGTDMYSVQAQWLKEGLAASTTVWNVVYDHYPPYSSGYHGSIAYMRWPFASWGADVVFSGHDHDYERLMVDGIPYIVDGLGGGAIYEFKDPLKESVARYNTTYGAMLVTATHDQMTFQFFNRHGKKVDWYTIIKH